MAQTNVIAMPMTPDGIRISPIVRKDMTEDFVAPSGYTWGQSRFLGSTQDDVEIEINLETYDKMENDSTIVKSKQILVTNALADELQFAPGATEENVGPDEYKVYTEIMEFCERVVGGLDRPYRESMEQLLGNSIKYGHGIAETTWEYRTDGSSTKPEERKIPVGPKTRIGAFWAKITGGLFMAQPTEPADPSIKRPSLKNQKLRLMPKSIRVKPRNSARFVVDDFMNVLGLAPAYNRDLAYNEIIDRDKFLVLTLMKRDEDPRGKSLYRASFNWYNLKTQLPSEMMRFILEEAVPKAVVTLPDNATPFEYDRDEDGNIQYEDPETKLLPKMLTAVESMKNTVKHFRGGSGVVIPHGATFEPYKKGLTGANDANLFGQIIKLLNDEIENSILLQTLAQSEGQHQARSASQQVAELLHNLVFWIRWLMAVMTLTDLCEVAVEKNFGKWALRYMPFISLGDFVRRDWADDLEVIARAYFWGFIDDTQRAELMAWLNLPKPGPSRQELGLTQTAQADVNGDPIVPNGNRPDKQAGTKNRNKGNGTEKKNVKQSEDTGFSPLNMLGNHRGRTVRVTRDLFSNRR
jgi:hypothetical protein